MSIATILTAELIEQYTRNGQWGDRIWPDHIDATADAAPERLAIIDAKGSLNYGELRALIDHFALHLLDIGIQPEERVALQLPNWREFLIARFALARIGAVTVPMPIDWRQKEVEQVLGATEAAGIIVPFEFHGRNYMQEIADLEGRMPTLRMRLVAGDSPSLPPGWTAMKNGLAGGAVQADGAARLRARRPGANEVDIIVPTSGSSAAPKLVVRTPNCFLATSRQFVEQRGHFTGADIIAGLAPITRGMGYYAGIASAVVAGSSMALLERFSPEGALQWLQTTRATIAIGVPTQLIKMLQVADFGRYDLSALRMVVNGGAAMPPDSAKEAEQRFGCVVLSAYGSVEGATPFCTARSDPPAKRHGTVGRIMQGMELRMAREDGSEAPVGDVGEITYRGPGLSLGFWRDPDAYRKLLNRDGWFPTGDLGVVDQDGFLTIVGRKKEIIIRGGINISPAEVEGMIQQHPDVAQVAVVKMPDRTLGEKCCAYIVPRPGCKPTVESMAAFLDGRGVAKYKFPERIELRNELPTTPDGGKILRRALEDDICGLLMNEGAL